jgi:glutathione S-transferase
MLEPEERRLPQAAADYRAWFLARWRSVEDALAGRDYLCGGRFTMADICVGFSLHLARTIGIEEAMTHNVAAWAERIFTRPAFIKASA